ncbi:MAG: ferredoxin:glutaredoxin reductase [Spirochaetes bacterium]|nr:ferredoxin:glutaredoxin reductase [Spirochaetota bacterium]
MNRYEPSNDEINKLYEKLNREAEEGGYHLNPDSDFTKALVKSLLVNKDRYGYMACPCRLAEENYELDKDIICPCIYRDPDLTDFAACYCGLYVTDDIINGQKKLKSIPDRQKIKSNANGTANGDIIINNLKFPIWRCTVCGYICARENPPEKCPICKVSKDRFEILINNK